MSVFTRSQLLVSVGGDVLAKYGRWTRNLGSQSRGGEGLKETFTRSTVGLALQSDGYYLNAQANCPRAEWSVDPITGLLRPYLLVEGNGSGNQLLHNQAIGGTSWTLAAATQSLVGTDPLRGANFAQIVPTIANTNRHGVSQSVTILGSTDNLSLTLWAGRSSAAAYQGVRLFCTDGGGSNGFVVAVNLLTGAVISSGAFGTGTCTAAVTDVDGGANVRIRMWGGIGTGTTAVYQAYVYDTVTDCANDTAYMGDAAHGVNLWGAQLQDAGTVGGNTYPPTSVILTTGLTASCGPEVFSVPFAISPRPLAVYAKFLELGTLYGADFQDYWQIGQVAASLPAEFFLLRSLGHKYDADHGHPQGTEVGSLGTIAPTFGQQVEVLSLLFADGSVQIIESLAGATEIAGTRSAPNPNGLGIWGNAPTLLIGANAWAMGLIALKVIDNTNGAITTLASARAVPV